MPRYIDAEKLEQHFEYCIAEAYNTNGVTEDFDIALKAVKNQPTADVSPVRHGRFRSLTFSGDTIICSECKIAYNIFETNGAENFNFCPHCGAKMDGDGE